MTGAPLPAGADAVVMIEHTQELDGGGRVRILRRGVKPGENVMLQGTAMRCGDVVLRRGHELRPMELGLLAEIGAAEIAVYARPRVAVLATGDELVDYRERPGPSQIRNSNGPMLLAMADRAGAWPVELGVARDDEGHLRRLITAGLECDVLVLSGGVSAGVLDLTPRVLEQLGVKQVFHKVNLKPGKPLWFGISRNDGGQCLVFGLPGNPVSSLVCFELFVRPALERLAGFTSTDARLRRAVLTEDFSHRGDRWTYYPARFTQDGAEGRVTPLAWKGSADLRTLVDANAYAVFPPGESSFAAGEPIDVHLL
jgi:molybdopterin molybdotransferase